MIEKGKRCFILKCKSDRAKNRVRQFCQYNNLEFRTLSRNIVVYEDSGFNKKWMDVEFVEAMETTDKVGHLAYL